MDQSKDCNYFQFIRGKASTDIKNVFDSKPVYNKNFLKTKKKSYGDEATTDFHNNETPKVDSNHNYLALISLDSALEKDENYYPEDFFKRMKIR